MTSLKHLQIDEFIVNQISNGVNTTFSTMLGIKPAQQKLSIHDEYSMTADISGLVNISQDKIEGTLIVSFDKTTILKLLSKMYRKEITEIDKSVSSGVGELTNIIFGIFKKNLNENGFSFKMALPKVIMGTQHEVTMLGPGKTVVIPFESEIGPFYVMLTVYPEEHLKIKAA